MISEKRRKVFEDTVRECMTDASDEEVALQVDNMAYLDEAFRDSATRIMGEGYVKIRVMPSQFGPNSYTVTFRRITVASKIWDCHHVVSIREFRLRKHPRPADIEVRRMQELMKRDLPAEIL